MIYHLTSSTNPNLWHSFKCTIFAILLCLCLFFFCASLLHTAIMRVIVSYLFLRIAHSPDTSRSSVFLIQFVSGGFFLCCKYQFLHFILQIKYPNPSPCLLFSSFFCFSYKFGVKLCLSITYVFLTVDTGPSHSENFLSLLEGFINLSSFLPLYRERFFVLQILHSLQC